MHVCKKIPNYTAEYFIPPEGGTMAVPGHFVKPP